MRCFALLLLAVIATMSMGLYAHKPAYAYDQPIVVNETDPQATFSVTTNGTPTLYNFTVKGTVSYTLDLNSGPPALLSAPVIKNIRHSVTVINGNTPDLPFGLKVQSSVDIYNANGTYLTTVTGSPNASNIHDPKDIVYDVQDSSSIPTQTPYTPGASDNFGKVLFILKHHVTIYADDASFQTLSPALLPTYKVTAPY